MATDESGGLDATRTSADTDMTELPDEASPHAGLDASRDVSRERPSAPPAGERQSVAAARYDSSCRTRAGRWVPLGSSVGGHSEPSSRGAASPAAASRVASATGRMRAR